tara:strand:- start:101 stop:1006 length:906 start_codon:yes stop_codon:yes gene_type:complete
MTLSLVTGGAGFIGSHIIDKLINYGHEVICIDNEYSDNESFFWNKDAKNHLIDINDYESMKIIFKDVDFVFHCAAEARIGTSIENPIKAVQNNVSGTCTVLQCARECGIKRVIYSSTSSGYGNNPCPNREDQPDDCLNPYSVSKIAGEKLCKMYNDLFGLQTIIFRYFNVFGERAPKKGQYSPVTGIFLRQMNSGEPLTIVGDGEQRRDFIYVGDVAEANVLAAVSNLKETDFGEVYNLGSGENVSINEIASYISKNIKFIPFREGEVRENLANIEKVKNLINWEPKVSIKDWTLSQLNIS